MLRLSCPTPSSPWRGSHLGGGARSLALWAALSGLGAGAVAAEPLGPPQRRGGVARAEQLHGGVPVLGGGVVTDLAGRRLADTRRRGLTVPSTPTLSEAEARSLALRPFVRARGREVALRCEAGALTVLSDGQGGRLLWRFRCRGEGPADVWRVSIDAHDGRLLERAPERLSASGQVYAQAPTEDELDVVDLPGLSGGGALAGEVVDVKSVTFSATGEQQLVRWAAADVDGNFYFSPDQGDPEDPFVEVNAYWHATQTYAFFQETFAHPVPEVVQVYTNYREAKGEGYDNAYFTYGPSGGYQLTFGQGITTDFGYDPGVVIHEFSHGIVEDVVGMMTAMSYPVNMDEYGLHPAPGGLTEGLPDYWSVTRNDRSTAAVMADGTPIRDLDNGATCPASVLGEAHQDGEVIGGSTWEIREALGAAATDALVYGAMQRLSTSPTYAEFAAALVDAAGDLVSEGRLTEAEVSVVRDIVDARGLSTCGRDTPISPEQPGAGYLLGADFVDASLCEVVRGLGVRIGAPFQYTLTIPEDPEGRQVTGLSLNIDLSRPNGGTLHDSDLDYTVYARADELVHYEINPLDILGYTFLLPTGSDNADLEWPGAPASVSVTAEALGIEVLPAGSTWTFGILGMNCVTTAVEVTPAFTWSEPPPAQINPLAGEYVGGCAGLRSALLLPWVGLGIFGLRRRRAAAAR